MTKAVVVRLDPHFPNVKRLRRVVEALESGEVIIYPTDSVYGMACDVRNLKAIERIRSIKGIGAQHHMSFICSDLSQAAGYVNIDNSAFALLKRVLPGPYTIILEASRDAPKKVLGRRKTIGIRIPDSSVARYLVESLMAPLVSTSVVDEEGEAMLDPDEIYKKFGGQVGIIVEQGYIGGEPSTVLAYTEGEWEVVREGKGSVDFLE